MKKLLAVSFVLMFAMLTGCANYAEDYDKNTIIVKGNGSLVEVAVEDFSESSVTEMDLTAYIEKQIEGYNTTQDKEVVKNNTLLTEDMSKVKLVLTYKDIDSFNGFNLLECILEDFSEANEDYMRGSFTAMDGSSVKASKMEDTKKAKVFVISEETDVVVDGEILYYNNEVSVKDGVATTTGEDNAIIIFK